MNILEIDGTKTTSFGHSKQMDKRSAQHENDTVVIINFLPMRWPIETVNEAYRGADKIIRTVSVNTSTETVKRKI